MQIQCPACETAYEVPDQIRAGRTVQCAACGVKWAPVPERVSTPMPAPIAPAAPAAMAPSRVAPEQPGFVASPLPAARLLASAEPGQPRSWRLPAWKLPSWKLPAWRFSGWPMRSWALPAAWAASLVLVIGLAAVAIVERDPVMQAWPPSTRLFAAIGLH